jgi:hypothetical protein
LRDVLRQSHPGLRQGKPERLVAVVLRRARHCNALLRILPVILNTTHDAPRLRYTGGFDGWSQAVPRSSDGGMRA